MNAEEVHRLALQTAISFFFNSELLADADADFEEALNRIVICHYKLLVLK